MSDSSSSVSEKFKSTQVKEDNNELDRRLFETMKKFAEDKGLTGGKGRPSTLMQKTAIYKAGYAQGCGKAAKATAKKAEKRVVQTKKVMVGRVEKTRNTNRAVAEGPYRLAC